MNREVVLVSSGAIAEGMQRLGWTKRPHAVNELQAAAAVGQMGLAQAYESCFRQHGLLTSQILLTHDDLSDRKRYLNARSALRTLLALGVIPVINENDTVATDEIRVGDNDTLGSLVTNLVEADVMIILTDQTGLFSADPRKNPDATLVTEADASDAALEKMAGGAGSAIGLGGMLTKITAAQRAARGGAHTLIASGHEPDVLVRLAQGERIGTLLLAKSATLAARKQWLADHLQLRGRLMLDAGAVKALQADGKSLLPIGVYDVSGEFERGEVVSCHDESTAKSHAVSSITVHRKRGAFCARRPAKSRPSWVTSARLNSSIATIWCCCNVMRTTRVATYQSKEGGFGPALNVAIICLSDAAELRLDMKLEMDVQ